MLAVGDEGLGAIDDVEVAIAHGSGANAGEVRASARLGHADGRDGIARCQLRQPDRLHRLNGQMLDIRRADVRVHADAGGQRGQAHLRHFVEDDHGILKRHANTAVLFRLVYAEQAVLAQLVPDFARHPRILFPLFVVRADLVFEEALDVVAEEFEFSVINRHGYSSGQHFGVFTIQARIL